MTLPMSRQGAGAPRAPRGYGGRKASRVATRAQWHDLLGLARAVARATADGAGGSDQAEEMARHRLAHGVRGSLTGVFNVECGYAAYNAANGFVQIAEAFARDTTPPDTRRALAPVVDQLAAFLDQCLWDAAHAAFEAAHRNRPEVD